MLHNILIVDLLVPDNVFHCMKEQTIIINVIQNYVSENQQSLGSIAYICWVANTTPQQDYTIDVQMYVSGTRNGKTSPNLVSACFIVLVDTMEFHTKMVCPIRVSHVSSLIFVKICQSMQN